MNQGQKHPLLTVLHICVIVVGIGFLLHFSHSIYSLWRRGDVVQERELRLRELEKEQEDLKNKLSYALTTQFIEQEARNKLNMVQPGETLVVLSQEYISTQSMNVQQGNESIVEKDTKTLRSNVQDWWRLLFLGK
jgi:cell division protein FtsB